ncbi:hypothetical protein [Adhaeretor mobilis]|uniref:hypothetical protein n=1 Tax=Adhaeretor mobilis TaxID=1930276 RepID=UPI0011A63012|nr:hypothetical protein [Adhaeretor mobilis]
MTQDPAAISEPGWDLIHDTNAIPEVSTAFANDDNRNVTKITASNDAISQFTSSYFFYEHDILREESETTRPENFWGQDAGDYLLINSAALGHGTAIDLNDARFDVDFQMGNSQFGSRPVFHFAVILDDGFRWTVDDAIASSITPGVLHGETDPISTGTNFRRIIKANGGVPGQRLRLFDTPAFLSNSQLASVQAIGLYVQPLGEL